MTSSTFFITWSTFSYQKAQENKDGRNYAKRMLVVPNLCYAFIFGQLRVFLSKPVNQAQFNKTIIFLRLSRLQAYFHDIRHVFHNIKHFFIPKSTKRKSCWKICKTNVGRTNFVLRVYFWLIKSFPFQTG